MKTKLKNNKGITLVALIITIIVLLILAMVSIRLVMNGGIIDRAERGTQKYSEEELKEQIKLAHSEYEMQKYMANAELNEVTFLHSKLDPLYGAENVNITGTDPLIVTVNNNGNTYELKLASNGEPEKVEMGPWVQDGETITNSKTNQTLVVGDKVYYNSGVAEYEGEGDIQGKWGVIGVENGNLLILSTECVGDLWGIGLYGKEDYLNDVGIGKLNAACAPFKNETYADSARSIKIEDIYRILKYTPEAPVTHSYTMVNGNVKMDDNEPSGTEIFEDVNGKKLPDDGPIEVTEYKMMDYPDEAIYTSTSKLTGLYLLPESCDDTKYWFASKYCDCSDSGADWGFIAYGNGPITEVSLWNSYYGESGDSIRARAVVTLKSNIQLSGDSTNGWTIQ